MKTDTPSHSPLRRPEPVRSFALTMSASCVLLLAATEGTSQTPTAGSPVPPPHPERRLVIPDGTPVHFRLVRGLLAAGAVPKAPVTKPGDAVRLVVASDVRIAGQIVIARGARAEATVIAAWGATENPPAEVALFGLPGVMTGWVELRLEWVETVTGDGVLLRAELEKRSKPVKFKKPFVPAGKRLKGFVDGEVSLPEEEVKQAQGRLPAPNPKAVLTIYRTGGQKEFRPWISCRETKLAQLGERQYLTVALAPGKHSFRAEQKESLELVAEAGQDYFLRLKSRKLKLVDVTEGEDAVAELEPVLEKDAPASGEACVPQP